MSFRTKNIIWIVGTLAAVNVVKWVADVGNDSFKETVIWLLVWTLSAVIYVGMVLESYIKEKKK